MIIHWWDVSKGGLADGNLRSPNTPLRLRSEHHYKPAGNYEIYRLPPKFLRSLRRSKWVTSIGAGVAAAPSSSVYWSTEDWPLSEPEPQNIVSFFKARAINQKGRRIRGRSALIRSSLLSIDEQQRSRKSTGGVGAIVHVFTLGAQGEVVLTQKWVARAPIDPRVEISLMHGEELLGHLSEVANHFEEQGRDDDFEEQGPADFEEQGRADFSEMLGQDGATYFVDEPSPAMPDLSQRLEGDVGAGQPVTIEVEVGRSETLRTAYAVKLQDVESGYITISDPVFLTAIRGEIIKTHLPLSLLSQGASDVLRAFVEAGGDLRVLAEQYGRTTETVWDDLVSATDELGADSVYDAATFASQNVDLRVPATL